MTFFSYTIMAFEISRVSTRTRRSSRSNSSKTVKSGRSSNLFVVLQRRFVIFQTQYFYITIFLQTGLADNSVNIVVDKGTLDALSPANANEQSQKRVRDMFKEVDRVLAPLGRYLVVSLAQDHIVHSLLDFFLGAYLVRIHKVESEKSFSMPVMLFALTKLRSPLPIAAVSCNKRQKHLEIVSASADRDGECSRLVGAFARRAASSAQLARAARVCMAFSPLTRVSST